MDFALAEIEIDAEENLYATERLADPLCGQHDLAIDGRSRFHAIPPRGSQPLGDYVNLYMNDVKVYIWTYRRISSAPFDLVTSLCSVSVQAIPKADNSVEFHPRND
jgi:hypothetical protein